MKGSVPREREDNMTLVWMAGLFFGVFQATARAAEAAAPVSPVQDVLTALMQLAALVLAGLVAWAVKLLAAKFKITVSAEQEALVRKIAQDAVFYAEEWAAQKSDLAQKALKAGDQLNAALGYLIERIPGVDREAAQKAIHAALGRTLGLGASRGSGTPSGE